LYLSKKIDLKVEYIRPTFNTMNNSMMPSWAGVCKAKVLERGKKDGSDRTNQMRLR
jgi:hypothetical protein